MTNVTITQENKLVVNYDTYEISPSNFSDLVIENPWFLDTSSAPDFINLPVEQNSLTNIEIPADTYNLGGYKIKKITNWDTSTYEVITINNLEDTHANILSNAINQLAGDDPYPWHQWQLYFGYITTDYSWCTCIEDTYENTDSTYKHILLPPTVSNGIARTSLQQIPFIKSITITFDVNKFSWNIEKDFHLSISQFQSSSAETLLNTYYKTIQAGTYTQSEFLNTVLSTIGLSWSPSNTYLYDYNYYTNMLISDGKWYRLNSVTDSDVTIMKLYDKFLAWTMEKILKNPFITPANHRCLSLSSGTTDVDTLINNINSNVSSTLFTITSNTHDITVIAEMPFIINPACSMAVKKKEADTERTFSNQHRICYHPMYQQIDTTVTYNGRTKTISGRYTPAELLQEINNLTGVQATVSDTTITFDQPITLGNNNFFSANNTTTPVNTCELTTMDLNLKAFVPITEFKYEYISNVLINTPVNITPTVNGNLDKSYTITSGNLPSGLTLNTSTGVISGTPTVAGEYSIDIKVNDEISEMSTTLSINVYKNVYSYCGCLINIYQTLPYINNNTFTSYTLTQGHLPTGLTLNSSTGEISGTPTVIDSITVTITMTDGNSEKVERFTITVTNQLFYYESYILAINIQQEIIPTVNTFPPYTLTSGNLPTGLTFNSTTGVISGTPTNIESTTVTIKCSDGNRSYDVNFNIDCQNITIFDSQYNTYYFGSITIFTKNGEKMYHRNFEECIYEDGEEFGEIGGSENYIRLGRESSNEISGNLYLKVNYLTNLNVRRYFNITFIYFGSISVYRSNYYLLEREYRIKPLIDYIRVDVDIASGYEDRINIYVDDSLREIVCTLYKSFGNLAFECFVSEYVEYRLFPSLWLISNPCFNSEYSLLKNVFYLINADSSNYFDSFVPDDTDVSSGTAGISLLFEENKQLNIIASSKTYNYQTTFTVSLVSNTSTVYEQSYDVYKNNVQSLKIIPTDNILTNYTALTAGTSVDSATGVISVPDITDNKLINIRANQTDYVIATFSTTLSITDGNIYNSSYDILSKCTTEIHPNTTITNCAISNNASVISIDSNNGYITIEYDPARGPSYNFDVSGIINQIEYTINLKTSNLTSYIYEQTYSIKSAAKCVIDIENYSYSDFTITDNTNGVSINSNNGDITITKYPTTTTEYTISAASSPLEITQEINIGSSDKFYNSSYTIIKGYKQTFNVLTDITNYTLSLVNPPANVSLSNNGTITLDTNFAAETITVSADNSNEGIEYTIDIQFTSQEANIYNTSYTVYSNTKNVITPNITLTNFNLLSGPSGMTVSSDGTIEWNNPTASANATITAVNNGVTVYIPVTFSVSNDSIYSSYTYIPGVTQSFTPILDTFSQYELTSSVTGVSINSSNGTISLNTNYTSGNITVTVKGNGVKYTVTVSLSSGSNPYSTYNYISGAVNSFYASISYPKYELTSSVTGVSINSSNGTISLNTNYTSGDINVRITDGLTQYVIPINLSTVSSPYENNYNVIPGITQSITASVTSYSKYELTSSVTGVSINSNTGTISLNTNYTSGNINVTVSSTNSKYAIPITLTTTSRPYLQSYAIIKGVSQIIAPSSTYDSYKLTSSVTGVSINTNGVITINGNYTSGNISVTTTSGKVTYNIPITLTTTSNPYQTSYTIIHGLVHSISASITSYDKYTLTSSVTGVSVDSNNGTISLNTNYTSGDISVTVKGNGITYTIPVTINTNGVNQYQTSYTVLLDVDQIISPSSNNYSVYSIKETVTGISIGTDGKITFKNSSAGPFDITVVATKDYVKVEIPINIITVSKTAYNDSYTYYVNVDQTVTNGLGDFFNNYTISSTPTSDLSINNSGTISGSINTAGNYTVTVTGSNDHVSATFTININVLSSTAYESEYTMYSSYQHTITCGLSGLSNFNITSVSGVSIDTNGTITIGSNVSNNVDITVTANNASSQLSFDIKLKFIEGELYQSEYNLIAVVTNQIEPNIVLSGVTFEIDNLNNLSINSQGNIDYIPQSSGTTSVTVEITSDNLTTYVPITFNINSYNIYKSEYTLLANKQQKIKNDGPILTNYTTNDDIEIDSSGNIIIESPKQEGYSINAKYNNVLITYNFNVVLDITTVIYSPEYDFYVNLPQKIKPSTTSYSNYKLSGTGSVTSDGIYSYTPATTDQLSLSITCDKDNVTATINFTVNVNSGTFYYVDNALLKGYFNEITNSDSANVFNSYSATCLPPNLNIDNVKGYIYGTPESTGTIENIEIECTNNNNSITYVYINITISEKQAYYPKYLLTTADSLPQTIDCYVSDLFDLFNLSTTGSNIRIYESSGTLDTTNPNAGKISVIGRKNYVNTTFEIDIEVTTDVIYYSEYTLIENINQSITPGVLTSFSGTGLLGLNIASNGIISGSPQQHTMTYSITGSSNGYGPVRMAVTIIVQYEKTYLSSYTLFNNKSQTINGGSSLYTSYTANNLPNNLSINNSGTISGSVSDVAKTYNVSITASNDKNVTASMSTSITVSSDIGYLTEYNLVTNLSQTITCDIDFDSYNIVGKPSGMTFSDGVITWTPTSSGDTEITITGTLNGVDTEYEITLHVTDEQVYDSEYTFLLNVPQQVTPKSTVFTSFSSEDLNTKTGLDIASNGIISGSANKSGTFDVTVTASNDGVTATIPIKIMVLSDNAYESEYTMIAGYQHTITCGVTMTNFSVTGLTGVSIDTNGTLTIGSNVSTAGDVTVTASNDGNPISFNIHLNFISGPVYNTNYDFIANVTNIIKPLVTLTSVYSSFDIENTTADYTITASGIEYIPTTSGTESITVLLKSGNLTTDVPITLTVTSYNVFKSEYTLISNAQQVIANDATTTDYATNNTDITIDTNGNISTTNPIKGVKLITCKYGNVDIEYNFNLDVINESTYYPLYKFYKANDQYFYYNGGIESEIYTNFSLVEGNGVVTNTTLGQYRRTPNSGISAITDNNVTITAVNKNADNVTATFNFTVRVYPEVLYYQSNTVLQGYENIIGCNDSYGIFKSFTAESLYPRSFTLDTSGIIHGTPTTGGTFRDNVIKLVNTDDITTYITFTISVVNRQPYNSTYILTTYDNLEQTIPCNITDLYSIFEKTSGPLNTSVNNSTGSITAANPRAGVINIAAKENYVCTSVSTNITTTNDIFYYSEYTLLNGIQQTISCNTSLYKSFTAERLPEGMTIDTNGNISGIPTSSNVTTITGTGLSNEKVMFKVTINLSDDIPYASNYIVFNNTEQTIPCDTLLYNDYSASNLPSNLSINTTSGFISGEVLDTGTHTVTITARNDKNVTATMSTNIEINTDVGYLTDYYLVTNATQVISCGVSIFTGFSITNKPTDMSFSEGIITWKPTSSGDTDISVTGTLNELDTKYDMTLHVSGPAYDSEYTLLVNVQQTINCKTSVFSNYSSADLKTKTGLDIDSSGNISGTPTNSGTFDVTITASNTGVTATFNVRINVTSDNAYESSYTMAAGYNHTIKCGLTGLSNFSVTGVPGISIDSLGTISIKNTVTENDKITVSCDSDSSTLTFEINLVFVDETPYEDSYNIIADVINTISCSTSLYSSFSINNKPAYIDINTSGTLSITPTGAIPNITVLLSNGNLTTEIPISFTVDNYEFFKPEYTILVNADSSTIEIDETLTLTDLSANFPEGMEIDSYNNISIDTPIAGEYTIHGKYGTVGITYNFEINTDETIIYYSNYDFYMNVNQSISPVNNTYSNFTKIEGVGTLTNGTLSYSPTASGTNTIQIQGEQGNITAIFKLVITVHDGVLYDTNNTILLNYYNKIDHQTTNIYSNYSVDSQLPTGLEIDSVTGVISGTPTTQDTYDISIILENDQGAKTKYPITITVSNTRVYYSSYTLNNVGVQYISPVNDIFDKYTITSNPSTFTINDTTGTITIDSPAAGNLTVDCEKNYVTTTIPSTISVSADTIYYSSYTLITGLSQEITPSGDYTSYSATNLPTGLEINNSGVISGIPTASGTCQITCTDANGASITIPVVINISNDIPYLQQYNVVNEKNQSITAGTNLFTSYTISSAPNGLTIDNSGTISGTVDDSSGTYNVEIVGSNSQRVTCYMYSKIIVNDVTPYLSEYNLAQYATHIITCNANLFTSFSITNEPNDMSFSEGVITWRPTTTGDTPITISCFVDGIETTYNITLHVSGPAYENSYIVLPNVEQSIPCKNNIFTEYSSSDLKSVTGLDINTTNGTISGTPTSGGSVTITAKNTGITASIPITFTANSTTVYYSEYLLQLRSYQIIRPGSDLGTFTVTNGTLPSGMDIDSDTGIISGIPVSSGDYSVTIGVSTGDSTINYNILIKVSSITGLGSSYTILNDVKQTLNGSKDPSYGEWVINDKPSWISLSTGILEISKTSFTETSYQIIITANYSNGGPTDIVVNLTINNTKPYNDSYTLYKGGSYNIPCNLGSTYSNYEGTLPTGLSINSTSGNITGKLNDTAEPGNYFVRFHQSAQNIDLELPINFAINDKIYEQSYNVVPNNTVTVTPKSNVFTSFNGTNVSSNGTISFTPSVNTSRTVTAGYDGLTAEFNINFIVNTNTAYDSEYIALTYTTCTIPCGVQGVFTSFTMRILNGSQISGPNEISEIDNNGTITFKTSIPNVGLNIEVNCTNDIQNVTYSFVMQLYNYYYVYKQSYNLIRGITTTIPCSYNFFTSWTSNNLLDNMTLNNGTISWVPTTTGTTDVVVANNIFSRTYTIQFNVEEDDAYLPTYKLLVNNEQIINCGVSSFTNISINKTLDNMTFDSGTITYTPSSLGEYSVTVTGINQTEYHDLDRESSYVTIYSKSYNISFNVVEDDAYQPSYNLIADSEISIPCGVDVYTNFTATGLEGIGLEIDPVTGEITGSPTGSGTVTITASNDYMSKEYTVTINVYQENGYEDEYKIQLGSTVKIPSPSDVYTSLTAELPEGLSIVNKEIVGTPTKTGLTNVTIEATGDAVSKNYTVTFNIVDEVIYKDKYTVYSNANYVIKPKSSIFTTYQSNNIVNDLEIAEDGTISGKVISSGTSNITCSNSYSIYTLPVTFNIADQNIYDDNYSIYDGYEQTISNNNDIFNDYSLSDNLVDIGLSIDSSTGTISGTPTITSDIEGNVIVNDDGDTIIFPVTFEPKEELIFNSNYLLVLNATNEIVIEGFNDYELNNYPDWVTSGDGVIICTPPDINGATVDITLTSNNYSVNLPIELSVTEVSGYQSEYDMLVYVDVTIENTITGLFTGYETANIPPGLNVDSLGNITGYVPTAKEYNSTIIGTNNNLLTLFNIKFNVYDDIVYVDKYPVIANVLHTIVPQTSVFTTYTLDSTLPAGMTFANGVITINSVPGSSVINVTCENNISSLTYNLNVNVINEIFYKSYYELILDYENTFDNKLTKQIYTSFSATNLPDGLESDSNYCTIAGVPTEGGQLTIEATYDNCFANYNVELKPLHKSDIYADNYTLIEGLNNVITPIVNHFTFSPSANIPGMTINSKTGVISGKPLITSFNNETTLNVSLTNYNQSVTIPVTFTITSVPQSTYNVMVGIQQSIPFTGYTAWEAENLPPGLTIDDTGLISGAPESSDHSTYNSIITGTNGNLVTTIPVIFTVYDTVYSPSYDLVYGESTTIPGSPVYDNWTAENLPPGLTINPVTGEITGVPSETGPFITTISASNNESNETFTITFNVNFANIYSSSYDMIFGVSQFIPGSDAFTEYSVTGSLPPGLTINAGNGDITGSPSEIDTYDVVITVKNDDYTREYNVQFIVYDGSIYDSQYEIFIDFEQSIPGSEVFTNWTAENLPPGLTINPITGEITGKPTVEGSWDTVIHGSNAISSKSYPVKFFVINYLYSDFYIFSTNNVIIEPTLTQPGRYISNNLPAELYIDENTGIITGDNLRVNSYVTITYINDDYQINQTIKVKAPAYTYYYV